ncbi:MAG: hypothetical protein EZS28_034389 [Streblomastix strix]|uniref:Uncharacterized protein n=1 Tax=Streblomastix strix TaxID=222440 RepID=A0A5J4UIS1_9EUKA|nr:MAG: hypothetical protein EZS28_034389 [Streblomastix strix]
MSITYRIQQHIIVIPKFIWYGIFLGCDPLSTTVSLQDQWNIVNTPAGELMIGVNNQITDNNKGLIISADGYTLTFNGNGFVDVGTNQSIAGISSGNIQINPTANGYDDAPNTAEINPCGLVLAVASQAGDNNRGIQRTADGNTLSFKEQIIAQTGANNGATDGSVNYSAGNPILWGANSLGTDGGFYSNGNNIFWRAHALQFDPYYYG